jgi:hypothetical protein
MWLPKNYNIFGCKGVYFFLLVCSKKIETAAEGKQQSATEIQHPV